MFKHWIGNWQVALVQAEQAQRRALKAQKKDPYWEEKQKAKAERKKMEAQMEQRKRERDEQKLQVVAGRQGLDEREPEPTVPPASLQEGLTVVSGEHSVAETVGLHVNHAAWSDIGGSGCRQVKHGRSRLSRSRRRHPRGVAGRGGIDPFHCNTRTPTEAG